MSDMDMNGANPILVCSNVTKKFGYFPALTDINLTLQRGRIIGLLGPNGSGKTTLIKLLNGLLKPTQGMIYIDGYEPGVETKKRVSYLPDTTYLDPSMRVSQVISFFTDFYEDFNPARAHQMLENLHIRPNDKLKTMSKGTKEKVQLILVMSRQADLYILDEPIGGVDPAARDYILNTIITNYNPESSVLISTHLIMDIENVLDDVIFLKQGHIELATSTDALREVHGKSVDALFREVFRC